MFYTNASKWFSLFFDFIHTKAGFVTVIVFPIMFAIYFYVKDFVKQVNETIRQQALKELEEEQENSNSKSETEEEQES